LAKTRIAISNHAVKRWRERAGPATRKEIAREITSRLLPRLHLGVDTDPYGAVHIAVGQNLVAVLYPSMQGGWELVTVYRRGTNEYEQEVAASEHGTRQNQVQTS